MVHGPLFGKLLLFALPLMLSGILQLLFNAADIIVVGRFAGDESLAAVGSTGSLINLLTNLFIGASVGANVVAAQFYGSGQRDKISDTVHTSVFLSLICGAVMTVVGVFLSGQMLVWMSSPDDVIGLATIYLRIYFLGMPAVMVYNFGSAILRAAGDTRRPLYFLMLAGIVNVLLNLLLVIVLHLGVVGVAAATVISQYISAALVLWCMVMDEELHFSLRGLHCTKEILVRIIRIGIPAGIQGTVFSLSNVVIQSAINSFGKIVVAGNSAAANIEGFVYVAMNSMYQTALTFIGQNYGAGEKKRILRVLFYCEGIVIVVGTLLGNLAVVFGKELLSIYSGTKEVVEAGLVRMQYICRFYALCGVMDVMVGALRGIGYSVMPMIVSLVGACGLRLLWIATVFRMDRTTGTLYLSYIVTWAVTAAAHVICFVIAYRRKPKHHAVSV
ncbi:MAG: MATE family efflux transporter [Clostridium sp.]|nr:MATE family efflux transporter [Clostridium sp.]